MTMTPAEHYAKADAILQRGAEPWLADAERMAARKLSWNEARDTHMAMLATAQVHATLATASLDTASYEEVELTDQERMVLRDAIRSDREIRQDTGVRASLLRSASEKLGLEL